MKVAVYAIAKNEEKFVDAWVASMKEADEIYVLDTGSTDKTVEKLRAHGVNVTILPFKDGEFRFDVARNESLALVPEDVDICVCTDLDEVWHESGWRKKIEEQWSAALKEHPNLMEGLYDYVHTFGEDGKTIISQFANFKIHVRKGVKWHYPCHEVLVYDKERYRLYFEGVRLDHHRDTTKPRGNYLNLLELAVREEPNDARALHYLGREYMYVGRHDDAIATFVRQLKVKDGWIGERAQAMRFISSCYVAKKDWERAITWAFLGTAEDPNQRESAMDLAKVAMDNGYFEAGEIACKLALRCKVKTATYLTNESNWGAYPYDMLAIAISNSKHKYGRQWFREAGVATSIALQRNMFGDERLFNNMIRCNGQSPVYPQNSEARKIHEEYDRIYAWDKDHPPKEAVIPDWSMFDWIVCLHYVGYENRVEPLAKEFKRVGLLDAPNFQLVETVRTVYEDRCLSGERKGILNLAINTLRTLQLAKAHGNKRILIFEDDVRFLKDMYLLRDIFAATPKDADIVVYDKMAFVYPPKFEEMCRKKRINKHFVSWDKGIYSGSCYSLSAKAIDKMIEIYEERLQAPDDAIQCDGLRKAFSVVNTSCQEFVKGGMFPERFGGFNTKNGYAFQGLDYGRYAVSEGYGYDKPLTEDDVKLLG